jgi:hypothetical protein
MSFLNLCGIFRYFALGLTQLKNRGQIKMATHGSPQDQFHELSFDTLAHPDPVYFIYQHAGDAFAAQTADENTKPIKLT